jgi:cytochrome c-type biogenesis protein CcmE
MKDSPMPKKNSKSLYAAALALFVFGVGYLLYSGFSNGAVYFIDVAEALSMPADKPQPVRLFGKVKAEGIAALEEGIGVRFRLEDKNNAAKSLLVTYRGAVPEAFAPGAEVIVEGLYQGGGSLDVSKLMTQCPSKYKKKET